MPCVTFSRRRSDSRRRGYSSVVWQKLIHALPFILISLNELIRICSRTRSFVISSVARNTQVPTLFIHPRNSQPEGAHRPETHTRMWPLLFGLVPERHPRSLLVVHRSTPGFSPSLSFRKRQKYGSAYAAGQLRF